MLLETLQTVCGGIEAKLITGRLLSEAAAAVHDPRNWTKLTTRTR